MHLQQFKTNVHPIPIFLSSPNKNLNYLISAKTLDLKPHPVRRFDPLRATSRRAECDARTLPGSWPVAERR